MKQQMEREQARLENEKIRRAEQLERARKQAELNAIRKKEQEKHNLEVILVEIVEMHLRACISLCCCVLSLGCMLSIFAQEPVFLSISSTTCTSRLLCYRIHFVFRPGKMAEVQKQVC